MYLESVTSDEKLAPCPCPSRPQPLCYPPKENKVHLGLSYCARKGSIYSIANHVSPQHSVETESIVYAK